MRLFGVCRYAAAPDPCPAFTATDGDSQAAVAMGRPQRRAKETVDTAEVKAGASPVPAKVADKETPRPPLPDVVVPAALTPVGLPPPQLPPLALPPAARAALNCTIEEARGMVLIHSTGGVGTTTFFRTIAAAGAGRGMTVNDMV